MNLGPLKMVRSRKVAFFLDMLTEWWDWFRLFRKVFSWAGVPYQTQKILLMYFFQIRGLIGWVARNSVSRTCIKKVCVRWGHLGPHAWLFLSTVCKFCFHT